MPHAVATIAFTPAVRAVQEAQGSRAAYARMEAAPGTVNRELGLPEAEFLAARDSFYMASVGETGWPYVQHRGGPPGFVRVLDATTLGFADFRGNRQYVTVGNVGQEPRVALFFMDYPNRTRLKVFGRARLVGLDDEALLSRLESPHYRARVERGFVVTVEGFDWNCPQHITPHYTREEISEVTGPLRARIAELERQVAALSPGGPATR
jgi:hypothetical protein